MIETISRHTYEDVVLEKETGVGLTSGLLSVDELLYMLEEMPDELP